MFCNITKNSDGEYIVKADNGRPSLLYKHLKATINNPQLALEEWAKTRTPEFAATYTDSILRDDNGEPSMMYVIPQNEFLYYGTKDKSASAKAKDKINRQDNFDEARKKIIVQSEIIKNTALKQVGQFIQAESRASRTNRYADVAGNMARILQDNPSAVNAIINFANYGSYYLREAREKIEQLKKLQDTNTHLEILNELGQLLIVFDNLRQFRNLNGRYEKTMFAVQMEGFFTEFGITPDRNFQRLIDYGRPIPATLFKIRNHVVDKVDKLKGLTSEEKSYILKTFDNLVANSENLTSVLDDILNEQDELQRIVRNEYYSTVTDWLWPYVEENQTKFSVDLQITKDELKNILKQAQQDAGIGEYTLASLSTINDPIAQAIRLAADQARQDAHLATVNNQSKLSLALKKQYGENGININQYDKYLKTISKNFKSVDEDGNDVYKTITTKAIITPYLTENLEQDRNVERDRQIEYYSAQEDLRISKLEAEVKKPGLTDRQREVALDKFEKAKEDREYNVRKLVAKGMNAWYETKYDIVKDKNDLIARKKKELNEEDFKLWYTNNVYQRTISADELASHKKNRAKFRMIHPEHLNDAEIKNSSFYKEGRTVNGKVQEYYVYEIYYGGEFTIPKEEYKDPRYNSLSNDKFFNELSRVYNESNNALSPRHKLKHGMLPQVEKNQPLFNPDKTAGENIRKMWSNMEPDIYAEGNEHEVEIDGVMMKVSKTSQNVDGTIIKTIPVKFTSILDTVEDLDTNLIETFTKFNAVTNRYKEMSRTDASARALKNLISGNPEMGIKAREIVLTDGKGNRAVTAIKNATNKVLEYAVKEKDHRLNRLVVDFIDDIWYGDTEEKDSFNLFGKDISLNKLSNFTSKWVSIQRLAGNLDSAISNLIIGKLAIFNESIAGRFYTMSEYYEASKIINQELFDGTVIKDYMQDDINQKSLYAQMMIRHDAIQGEFSNEYGIKVSKKTALEMGKDFLFFSQNGMEYTIQKRSMLCVSKGFKVMLPDNLMYDREANDGNGAIRQATPEELAGNQKVREQINLKYDSLIKRQQDAMAVEVAKKPTTKAEQKKSAATLSKMRKDLENIGQRKEDELSKTATNYFTGLDAYTRDENGSIQVKELLSPWFTPKVENQLRRRIQELNKKQQGIYSQFDKSQAQRHWLGKLALMFRKYLYSAYEHRFGDRKGNLAMGEETYGYQRQFINKFLADFKAYGSWAFTKLFDGSASPQEQYAINKTLTEYAVWASFMVLFWLLRSLNDDDDEKNWALSKTAYIVKRTEDSLSEFALPFGVGTLVRTFKNPFSSIILVEQIYEVFAVIADDPLNFGGEYERESGLNKKGDSKFLGKLYKVLPIIRQWGKFWTPEDQLKYYTGRKTNI